MANLLVTYTIEDPAHEAALNALLDRLESTRISPTSRVVDTGQSPDALFAALEQTLGTEDRVYVLTLDQGWAGYGYEAINDWLHRHVGPGPSRCP